MKRIFLAAVLLAALGLTACGQSAGDAAQAHSGDAAHLANPWRDATEAGARSLCPALFCAPDGAQNARWSVMESAADASGVPGALVQLKFELDGMEFTARAQRTAEAADQSGMYYAWTAQREDVLTGWDGLTCRCFRYAGEGAWADLCLWYDAAAGVSYSLSVTAETLDGFDLSAVAEAMCP